MTEESKQLLLKDLSSRLPYKPIVHAKWSYTEPDGERKYNEADRELRINDFYDIWHVKPYLRPLSSMTKEERRELCNIRPCYINSDDIVNGTQCNNFIQASECQDWLNAHHFDYRGLIELGLALPTPEGMYDFK